METKELTRGAGILLSITSLPSSYGIGTLGNAAFHFIDLLVDLKQSYWQMLPVGPTSFGNSPYQSFSAFAGNAYLIDLDNLAAEGLLTETEIRSFNWGDSELSIDYATIYKNRYKILQMAFRRFDTNREDFSFFLKENDFWINDYSLYRALKHHFQEKEWLSWDAPCRDKDPIVMEAMKKELHTEIEFHKFCQFEFFKQLTALKQYAGNRGIKLIGDIPLYVGLDSADVWANRRLFQLEENGTPIGVAGTTADIFSDQGQIWGAPIYDWEQMEQEGFSWWKERIRVNRDLFDVLRLDHFLGIVRYYMIPYGSDAVENGKWHKGPGKKLTDSIEEASGDARIIVDDIGPKNLIPGVKKLLMKTGWPGTRILMSAFNDDTANEHLPHNYSSSNLVVYPGTHDNETIVGYFHDKTDYELAYLYEYLNIKSKEEISDALIRTAYQSVADVIIIQMQDLLKLGNEARMNAPTTVGRNWQWRMGANSLNEERRAWIRTLAAVYRR